MSRRRDLPLWPSSEFPAIQNAAVMFSEASLHLPYVPMHLQEQFREFRPWRWGTRETKRSAYQWEWFVDEAATDAAWPDDYVLIEHAGHGVNSYALHYFVVTPCLAMFLAAFWGGAYMEEPSTRDRVNRIFEAASALVRQSEAIDPSVLPGRLVVAASDLADGGYVRWTAEPAINPLAPDLLPVEAVLDLASKRLAAPPESAVENSQPTGEESWTRFEVSLAAVLEGLEEDHWLVVGPSDTDRFVQFSAQGKSGIRAETVSNTYLPDNERLDDQQCGLLLSLGWNCPTYVPEAGVPEPDEGSPNYFVDVAIPVPWTSIAELAVRTLREVHGVPRPSALEYSSSNSAADRVKASLGIKRAID